jgi:hypothetical protein
VGVAAAVAGAAGAVAAQPAMIPLTSTIRTPTASNLSPARRRWVGRLISEDIDIFTNSFFGVARRVALTLTIVARESQEILKIVCTDSEDCATGSQASGLGNGPNSPRRA